MTCTVVYKEFLSLLLITLVSSLMKILLFPAYMSTDFEVHRNWLALTSSLPINKWYFENTSEWTLDYPPMFAWFEKFLSLFAALIDPNIVRLDNLDYRNHSVVYFQRSSVVICDFLLNLSAFKCSKSFQKLHHSQSFGDVCNVRFVFLIMISFNCGLFIVDHIHFQYNGFLFSILLLSFANILEGHIKWASFWFSILLNFKHIFMYVAPAYGVYLLRTFCMKSTQPLLQAIKNFSFKKLFQLGFIVIITFTVSFGPFYDHLDQVASRLFPFKRGLTHAYWAPNFWSLYNLSDKILYVLAKKMNFLTPEDGHNSSSNGLVQSIDHVVLPKITPLFTFLLTAVSMAPCLLVLVLYPSKSYREGVHQFFRSLTVCSLCSFMFGWHVHEKAILMAIIPYTLVAVQGTREDAKIFLILQTVGHYSLFPLLFQPFETVTKITLFFIYSLFSFAVYDVWYTSKRKWIDNVFTSLPLMSKFETLYIVLLIFNEFYCCLIHPFSSYAKKFQFIPLLLTSVLCSLGVTWSWILLYKLILSSTNMKTLLRKSS